MQIKRKAGVSAKLNNIIREINSTSFRVGWGEGIKYEDGTPVAMIAAQNEFGNSAKRIPPRPFMRPTISKNRITWTKKTVQGLNAVLQGNRNTADVMDMIGQLVAGDVRKAISKVTQPALKTATVQARLRGKKQGGSVSLTVAKPLVDTGYMLNSLQSEVIKK